MGVKPPLTYTMVVDPAFDRTTRRRIGDKVISYMRARAKRGQGVGGAPLKGPDGDGRYSDSYVNHRDFKAAGKVGRKVNLTFSGEMLFGMEVDDSQPGKVTIYFDNEDDNDKAQFLREKNYDWFGLSSQERSSILAGFGSPSSVPTIDQGLVSSFLKGLFRG